VLRLEKPFYVSQEHGNVSAHRRQWGAMMFQVVVVQVLRDIRHNLCVTATALESDEINQTFLVKRS